MAWPISWKWGTALWRQINFRVLKLAFCVATLWKPLRRRARFKGQTFQPLHASLKIPDTINFNSVNKVRSICIVMRAIAIFFFTSRYRIDFKSIRGNDECKSLFVEKYYLLYTQRWTFVISRIWSKKLYFTFRTKMDKVIISWYFKLFGILTQ